MTDPQEHALRTSGSQDDVSDEQREALDIAEKLIEAGAPVFAAPPCPAAHGGTCSREGHAHGKEEYDLPPKWQLTVPSKVWLERWRPGWALGMVGGHVADALDEDPRNGGDASLAELIAAGQMPRVFGVAETPSGGRHYVISPLGERKGIALPGLDYQGGAPDGQGRGFIWIAPTVKRSKAAEDAGTRRSYRWLQPPDLDYLKEFEGTDTSGEMLTARIRAARVRDKTPASGTDTRSDTREFTEEEARQFCRITLDKLMTAQVGGIEEAANAAAAQLSHFVPGFWSEEFAFSVLVSALGSTAYDPEHPASAWTADKFHAVLSGQGGRSPNDWRAVRKPESVSEIDPPSDEVDALIAEMLTAEEVEALPPPEPLITGLLNRDSESWIIGEPGSKKSFVATDMAGAVANGRPWQGLDVTQASVVMIVAEGAGGMSTRLQAYRKEHGPMGPNVRILPRPVQARDLKAWAVLVEACRRLKPGMVVIDTQARVTVGLEENSATEIGIYVEAVRAIREATGACVLTVHHTGRRGGDARGSSAIDGAQHTELKVKADGLHGTLSVKKQKDMPLTFKVIDLGLDEKGRPITSLVLSSDPFDEAHGHTVDAPEEWETGHGPAQVHLLKVLRDQGGSIGLTKSETRASMIERFYGGEARRLSRATFNTAWTKCREKVTHEGESIMANPAGEKWIVIPEGLDSLRPGEYRGNQHKD